MIRCRLWYVNCYNLNVQLQYKICVLVVLKKCLGIPFDDDMSFDNSSAIDFRHLIVLFSAEFSHPFAKKSNDVSLNF
jgi:hypothetical protein